MIDRYREILLNNKYISDNSELRECFRQLGGSAFVRSGLTECPEAFMRCFTYYADMFAKQWGEGNETWRAKSISYKYAFELMLSDESNPVKYNFQYILNSTPNSSDFCKAAEAAFLRYWTDVARPKMRQLESLADVSVRVGDARLSRYLAAIPETAAYVRALAARFTQDRELITLRKLYHRIFGMNTRTNFSTCDKSVAELLERVVAEEFSLQYEKFPAENHLQCDVRSNLWIFYDKYGPSLRCNRKDFTCINSPSLRSEVKYYLKYRFSGTIQVKDCFLMTVAVPINLLCELNPNIYCFADIDEVDARNLYITLENQTHTPSGKEKAATNIIAMFGAMKVLFKYLMSNHRDENIRSPRPHINHFAAFVFRNSRNYVENTAAIPENIMEMMDTHISELSEEYQLIYEIFSQTGMRTKEVIFLEAGCVSKSRYENVFELKYKPFKVLTARRRTNRPEYHTIIITAKLAKDILHHIEKTTELRKKYDLPYIFISKHKNYRATMISARSFLVGLNALAIKYDMCDENGELWRFTARQYRKTIAVTLIENGGTVEELAYILGHLSYSTACRHYSEVRKKKIAEMNTAFFKQKFELLLSGEQLSKFNEEERRLLYIDFCLSSRRVEFGHCIKKLSEGGCNSRNSLVNCVNCKNLCTGKKYLTYWKSLLFEQEKIVSGLLHIYKQNDISEYHDFKEYRQERNLLEGYKNIVSTIESEGL